MGEVDHNSQQQSRNIQIQKLLQAISNYKPTQEEIQSMDHAKKQMIKNIQRKFNNSKVNIIYKFPFNQTDSTDECQSDNEMPNIYNLKDQNKQTSSKSKSKQKKRKVLKQKSNNKSQNDFQYRQSLKSKNKDQNFINNIQKALKSGLKCQTPRVIKKQIVITNKKVSQKANQQQFISSQTNIKSKLKIKKPNSSLNSTKKYIHLRTQNNINFKPYHEYSYSKNYQLNNYQDQINQIQLFNQAKTQQKYVIYEESSEQSLFFNSRTNQNIDQNVHLQYPQPQFNVSDLKQKLRETSKSAKKDFKKHKRTATQGGCSEIKIKLFTNSFKKQSLQRNDIAKKLPFTSNIFNKSQNMKSSTNFMNRTVSSLSHHSLKKGIKLCGKIDQNQQRSSSKEYKKSESTLKFSTKNLVEMSKNKINKQSKQKVKKRQNEIQKCIQKRQISQKKQINLKAKRSQSKQRKIEIYQGKQNSRQNMQINKISKINSIMTSLKQCYKNKNTSKGQVGIKINACR